MAPIPLNSSKTPLLIILLTPLGVALLASGLYFFSENWGIQGGKTNEGRLVDKAVAITEVSSQARTGEGRWRIVLVNPDACTMPCLAVADRINSIKQLLGKDSQRLELLVHTNPPPIHRDLAHWSAIDLDTAKLGQLLPTKLTHYTLLVDPMHKIVLLYTFEQAGSELLNDLKRLLQLSRIG